MTLRLFPSPDRPDAHALLSRLYVIAARLKRASREPVRVFVTIAGMDLILWDKPREVPVQ